MTSLLQAARSEFATLWSLMRSQPGGESHSERLDRFYAGQADHYDSFRSRLLHGREELVQCALSQLPDGYRWIDVGGGTGKLLDFAGPHTFRASEIVILDLCAPLLDIARRRSAEHPQVRCQLSDAERFEPREKVDLITFSYSLSMMNSWWRPIERAKDWLRPGGLIAVVDFYVSERHPPLGFTIHPWITRVGWRSWFDLDGVYLRGDTLRFLSENFAIKKLHEGRGKIPYLPLVRAPYYLFIGENIS